MLDKPTIFTGLSLWFQFWHFPLYFIRINVIFIFNNWVFLCQLELGFSILYKQSIVLLWKGGLFWRIKISIEIVPIWCQLQRNPRCWLLVVFYYLVPLNRPRCWLLGSLSFNFLLHRSSLSNVNYSATQRSHNKRTIWIMASTSFLCFFFSFIFVWLNRYSLAIIIKINK